MVWLLGMIVNRFRWSDPCPSARWCSLGLSLGLGLLLLVMPGAQATDLINDLKLQQQQIEQQRSQMSQQRERLLHQEKTAAGELTGLRQTIKATTSQIQATEAKLQAASQRLSQLETTLTQAERRYQQQQTATVARLRYLQRQQVDRGWAVLLQSQNLNDFLDRRRRLKAVYTTDRTLITKLKSATEQLDRQRQQVERQKNNIVLLNQQLLAQKADTEAQAVAQQDMIQRFQRDRGALEAAEAQLAQDSQTVAVLIQQRSRSGSGRWGSGRMVFPCNGEITSGFGFRVHPILGDQRFHAGTDFGADYGSAIYAADTGTVIIAGWYGGYGNAVIIDHGGGVTTLYGHASEFYVTEGQTVQRGQPIAAVGSTGLSTGPHLHFEVRENGEPVDPLGYL
jgi:murein DD-endopeptidase MepM/ murein hydrolase activator NlpD